LHGVLETDVYSFDGYTLSNGSQSLRDATELKQYTLTVFSPFQEMPSRSLWAMYGPCSDSMSVEIFTGRDCAICIESKMLPATLGHRY
jgi:hypothetical protein